MILQDIISLAKAKKAKRVLIKKDCLVKFSLDLIGGSDWQLASMIKNDKSDYSDVSFVL